MKDQKEKLVWLILAWGVLAFACGNISGYMIRDAQRTERYVPLSGDAITGNMIVRDSIVFYTLHSEIRK